MENKKMFTDVKMHYDMLIDEGNDPVNDDAILRQYMDKWDGPQFIDDMNLSGKEVVLEIGIGTGRLATTVCEKCGEFYGIDLSPKTIERAKENLSNYPHVHLFCRDFLDWQSDVKFDVIYSSLTFLHIQDKRRTIQKIFDLLKEDGRFVLSIEKSQNDILEYETRKIKTYPDNVENISALLKESNFDIVKQYDTEFANIFVAKR